MHSRAPLRRPCQAAHIALSNFESKPDVRLAPSPLHHTPFHHLHLAAGAKMVSFAGFEMPIQYPSGITAEHNAVRQGCGVFDVSHMGEFLVRGPQAIDFVNYVTSNDVAALAVGQIHYSAILTSQGTFVDDCLVRRIISARRSNRRERRAYDEAYREEA